MNQDNSTVRDRELKFSMLIYKDILKCIFYVNILLLPLTLVWYLLDRFVLNSVIVSSLMQIPFHSLWSSLCASLLYYAISILFLLVIVGIIYLYIILVYNSNGCCNCLNCCVHNERDLSNTVDIYNAIVDHFEPSHTPPRGHAPSAPPMESSHTSSNDRSVTHTNEHKIGCGECCHIMCTPCCYYCRKSDTVSPSNVNANTGNLSVYDIENPTHGSYNREPSHAHSRNPGSALGTEATVNTTANGVESHSLISNDTELSSLSDAERHRRYRENYQRRQGSSADYCCECCCTRNRYRRRWRHPNSCYCMECDCVASDPIVCIDCDVCCRGATGECCSCCHVCNTEAGGLAELGGACDSCAGAEMGEAAVFGIVLLLFIFVVFGIFLVVGLGSVLIENILLRHIHVLQKKTLAQFYKVKDLDLNIACSHCVTSLQEISGDICEVMNVGVSEGASDGIALLPMQRREGLNVSRSKQDLSSDNGYGASSHISSASMPDANSLVYLTYEQELELQSHGLLDDPFAEVEEAVMQNRDI